MVYLVGRGYRGICAKDVLSLIGLCRRHCGPKYRRVAGREQAVAYVRDMGQDKAEGSNLVYLV